MVSQIGTGRNKWRSEGQLRIPVRGLVFYAPLGDSQLSGAPFNAWNLSGGGVYSCAVTGALWSSSGRAFDGDDFINLDALVTPLAATTVGTWSTWAKLTDITPAADTSIISFSDTDAVEIIYLHVITSGEIEATCYDGGVLQWNLRTDSTTLLTANTFARITVIQDGVSPIIRVNGVTAASSFTNSTDITRWFANCTGIDNGRLGVNHVNNGDSAWFTGTALETIIWNTNITAAQDTSAYLSTKGYYGL